jgi:filamin
VGVIDVAIVDPHGHKDTIRPVVSKKSEELWYVEYTAQVEGLHSVNVFYSAKAIPLSPFAVGVSPGE